MSMERAAALDAIIKALIDVLLTMPNLPPDLVVLLRELRGPPATVQDVQRIALDISNLCQIAQRKLGR